MLRRWYGGAAPPFLARGSASGGRTRSDLDLDAQSYATRARRPEPSARYLERSYHKLKTAD